MGNENERGSKDIGPMKRRVTKQQGCAHLERTKTVLRVREVRRAVRD